MRHDRDPRGAGGARRQARARAGAGIAHGTNPATAAALGYAVDAVPATADGRVDLDALKAKLAPTSRR